MLVHAPRPRTEPIAPVPTRLGFGCGTSMKIVYEPEHEQRSFTPLLNGSRPIPSKDQARLIGFRGAGVDTHDAIVNILGGAAYILELDIDYHH